MLYTASIIAYFLVVFAAAIVWNIGLFRNKYEELAGDFLREPPLFISGISAILIQGVAMTAGFALLYPTGQLDFGRGLMIALLVNIGSIVYGAFVVPGKFTISKVSTWVTLELAYGVIVTGLIGATMTLVWGILS